MSDDTTAVLPRRSDLAPEDTWDTESVFPTGDDWEAAFNAVGARLVELEQYRGRLGDSGASMLAGLKLRDELLLEAYRVGMFASLKVSEDATNAAALSMNDRASGLFSTALAAASFYEPEILALDAATLTQLRSAEAGLGEYDHYFDTLERRRAHVRSSEVEEVLAMASDATNQFDTIHIAISDADLKFGRINDEQGNEVELGQGNYDRYLHSADRSVRQSAWETSSDAFLALKNTFAATYAGVVKRDVLYARAHRYDSTLEAALAPNAIPLEVFHNLIETVRKNLPTWQRYFNARAKLLGIDKAHAWDITEGPLQAAGRPPQRVITFDEGVEIIAASLAPLGDEYVGFVQQGIEQRWVDRMPNAGKSGGAFSSGVPGTHPFILMSWQDDLNSSVR